MEETVAVAPKLERIQDEALRQGMEEAQGALRSGDYKTVVERASEAYTEVLKRRPHVLQGQERLRSILFFPRLGARLILDPNDQPAVVFDRDKFTFSEAVTYFEFAVDSLIKNEL